MPAKVVKKKVVGSKKKPKVKTKTKQYQTQSVKQSVVVHVTIPKSRRKKTGSIPRKAVRVPMTRMADIPPHLKRPTSNPYDNLYRSIQTPFKAPTAASLPTGDTYAFLRNERLKHFNNASTDTGGFEDVKPDPDLGDISIKNIKKEHLEVAVPETPKKAMGVGDVNSRQSSANAPPQSSSSASPQKKKPVKKQSSEEQASTRIAELYELLHENIESFQDENQRIDWVAHAGAIKKLVGKNDIKKIRNGYNNWKSRNKHR